jgi:hypothetical protein
VVLGLLKTCGGRTNGEGRELGYKTSSMKDCLIWSSCFLLVFRKVL